MSSDIEPVRSGAPARGYTWETFRAGNEAALTHGARSIRHVQPIADALRPVILEHAPWLRSPVYAGALEDYLFDEGRALLYRRWLDEHGHVDDEGEERSVARSYDRVQGRLAKARPELGLTPLGRGRLYTQAAALAAAGGDDQGLAHLLAEGAQILDARPTDVQEDDR